MWEENLKKIIDELKLYDEKINQGASKNEIKRLKLEAKSKLGFELPSEYLDIISKVNGLEFNGFILYGVDEYLLGSEINQNIYGLIEYNLIWHENEEQKKYLFLGESNISWYVYDIENKNFIELDNPSGEKIEKFNNFYEMFKKLLEDAVM